MFYIPAFILVFVLGIYSGFIIDRKILKRQLINHTKIKLLEAFVPAISDLDPQLDSKSVYTQNLFSLNIVKNNIEKQKSAVYQYANYLQKRKQKMLIKAWSEYAYPYDYNFPEGISDTVVVYNTFNPDEEPKIREVLRQRINKIIAFTK